MGQYYRFMNITKKQICDSNKSLLKLTEHSYLGNTHCQDILNLLNNEWKGDIVLHVGDYAEPNDGTTTSKLISKIIKDNDLKCSVYQWAENFEDIVSPEEKNIRYVYNHTKKEYIDLYKQPTQWCYAEDKTIGFTKFNSLAMLIACGNGLGGGDYTHQFVNSGSVGIWAGDSLESSNKLLDKYSKYKERVCLFDERCNITKNMFLTNKKIKSLITTAAMTMLKNRIDDIEKNEPDELQNYHLDDYGLLDFEKKSTEDYLKQRINFSKGNKEKGDICL
ncbi:MAG: hypothetical protein Q4G05_01570 [Clostridia bacterium]|nr:hypothetical protein [Clostridia bacterium]